MSKDFLTLDEVDALLNGVTGETDSAHPVDEASRALQPYDFSKQHHVAYGRLPALEIINERFARLFRVGLRQFLHRDAEISAELPQVKNYSEFTRTLAVPANINLVRAKPLPGTALFVIESDLIHFMVDSLFGGDGRLNTHVEGREFTSTEQRIILRLMEVVLGTCEKSWAPVHPVQFEYVRSETGAQFVNVTGPDEVVIVSTFTIELGSVGGRLSICIPYSMIEPVRSLLCSPLQGEPRDADGRRLQQLARRMQAAEVELVANLTQIPVTIAQLLQLKAGDVIPAGLPESVFAEIDGIPVMECRFGRFNGQYALKVNRMLNVSGADSPLGEEQNVSD